MTKSLEGKLRKGNRVRGSLVLVYLEHRAVQRLLVGSKVVSPGRWLKHQHFLGGPELLFIKDVGIHTMENVRGRVHVLNVASQVTIREIIRRVPPELRVA